MRKNIVKTIYLKEIKETLRDRKTVFLGIILPILLYPILILGFSQLLLNSQQTIAEKNLEVYFDFPLPELLEGIIAKSNGEEESLGQLKYITSEELRERLNKEELDLEEALVNKYISAYVVLESTGDYKIYYDSSSSDSQEALNRLEDLLFVYKVGVTAKIIENKGLEVEQVLSPFNIKNQNLAPPQQGSFSVLGQVLVILVMMGIVSGTLYPAIDSMAGEKERGTLETLLTLPVSNLEIVTGKYLAVSSMAIFTALLSMGSIALSIFFIVAASLEQIDLMPKPLMDNLFISLIIVVISITLLAMLITAVIMSVCALAKNVREASNYSTPVMLMFMLPAYASMLPNLELTPATAIIPIVNISLLIKSVLAGGVISNLMIIVLVSTLTFTLMGVIILSKLFNSEKVLFGEGKTFSILESRKNIRVGTVPGVSDGILMYTLVMLVFIYIGGYLQAAFGLIGIGMYQLLFLFIPLGYAAYIKCDLKVLFSIKKFSFYQLLASFLIWIGAFALSNLIANILARILPEGTEVAQEITNQLMSDSGFFITFLVVAILPALGEEILFRGFILSSFRYNGNINRKKYVWPIIISGLLFGLMHIYLVKILPTAILGIVFGYIVVKTGSIFIPMLLHLINNGLAVILTFKQNELPLELVEEAKITMEAMGISEILYNFLPLLIFGGICGYLGLRMLNNKIEQEGDYER